MCPSYVLQISAKDKGMLEERIKTSSKKSRQGIPSLKASLDNSEKKAAAKK